VENKILVQELTKEGLLSEDVLKKVLQDASLSGRKVDELIYERRLISEEKVNEVKSRLLNVPYKKIKVGEVPDDILKLIPEETLRNYKVVPISRSADVLVVGMVYPDDVKAQEALKFIAKQVRLNLGVYLASYSAWEEMLKRYSPYKSEVETAIRSLNLRPGEGASYQKIVMLEEGAAVSEEAPIIRIVASTLKEAVWQKVSDIHIEPQRDRLRIRFRLDGALSEVSSLPLELHQPIVSRVKILSNLKIDETRVPQDGRFRTVLFNRDIDFRVSTFPTPIGEKAAIRVLDPTVGLKGLEELGLVDRNYQIVKEGIEKPYGMILITGPTGSGKTTTLYALMQILNKEEVNIVSLEDPVEYFIDGLNQSQVRPEIGYDFASGLRQILRQDPDIIMVGEIRDEETASLVTHAALTGHIVLSTLHTTDALGGIPRLIDLGIKPYLIPPALSCIIAQRLVRRLCQSCKKETKPKKETRNLILKEIENLPAQIKKEVKIPTPLKIFEPAGCKKCNQKGFSGRIALFEILEMTGQLSEIILKAPTIENLQQEAKRQGMIIMFQDGILKVLNGTTTIEEVLRVAEEK